MGWSVNCYELWRGIGLLLAMVFAVLIASWFSCFWWDEPDWDHDETMLTPVLIDNGNGTITQTYVPTFAKSPVEEARDTKLKSSSKTTIIVICVVAVLLGAARGT